MRALFKNSTLILFVLICFETRAAQATASDVHKMADICMYTERLLKDYALIGMDVTYGDPMKDLRNGVVIIDKYLADIESHQLKASLDKEVKKIHASWLKIKEKLRKKPEKSAMKALYYEVQTMVESCKNVAHLIATDTGIKAEHDVVLIAQLGMDTQKLGALYMMSAWGVKNDKYMTEVESIINEFNRVEMELLQEDDKLVPAKIKKKLKAMDDHFRVLTILAKAAGKSNRFAPTRFERSTSKVFDEIREILELEILHAEKKI